QIGIVRSELLKKSRIFQVGGLQYGQALAFCIIFHRRGAYFLASSFGLVRRRDHCHNFEVMLDEFFQRGYGKFRCAHVYDPKVIHDIKKVLVRYKLKKQAMNMTGGLLYLSAKLSI